MASPSPTAARVNRPKGPSPLLPVALNVGGDVGAVEKPHTAFAISSIVVVATIDLECSKATEF